MLKIEEITDKVSNSYASKGYTIDPMTIIFIIGLIVDIAKMIMACYSTENYGDAVKKINNPSLLDKLILSRRIRKFAKTKDSQLDLDHLKESLLKIKLTESEFNQLTLELDKYKG